MAPRTQPSRSPSPPRSVQRTEPPEVVDPRWLLNAAAAVVAVGLLCAYATICGLFYKGQWQFVLHPSRVLTATPASIALGFQPVRFGDDASGQPQLAGWWIPSGGSSDLTALLLHSQNGTMSEALPAARALHNAGLNVLLFDYRGYGQSGGQHPTEALMEADARAALRYLTEVRHLLPSSILAYGSGLGASVATSLCAANPQMSGLILEAADGDTASRVEADQRVLILPMRLLFHESFPLADPLHTLRTPKLLISYTAGAPPVYAARAADPKLTVELPAQGNAEASSDAIRRFLDTYLERSPVLLAPGTPAR